MPMELDQVIPQYTTLNGWNQDLTQTTRKEHLPSPLLNYIDFIQQFTQTPITLVSVGPGREQTLFL
jgi:adenylosuccinate synthase